MSEREWLFAIGAFLVLYGNSFGNTARLMDLRGNGKTWPYAVHLILTWTGGSFLGSALGQYLRSLQ